MPTEGLVPPENRARIVQMDIQLVIHDFLNRHSNGAHCYDLAPHPAPLRQDGLPADASVLWARLDQDDRLREDALRAAHAHLVDLIALLPPESDLGPAERLGAEMRRADYADLLARIDAGLAAPPARRLVVAIESATYALVPRGAEPEEPFAPAAFFPPSEQE